MSPIRLYVKLLLRRMRYVPSFCKQCGRDVHDFHAPDDIWALIEPQIRHGHVLCYDCFVEKCVEAGLPWLYRLVPA